MMRPMLSYYGAKWRDARHYPAPQHGTIVEPFAGSAGYSLRHHTRNVVLVDLDEKIAGTWEYLIHASAAEIRALPLLAHGQRADSLPIPQEAQWLVGWWCNAAASTPCQTLSAWSHVRPDEFWGERIRDRIASQVDSIRHWRVIHGTYQDAPDVRATWFVDPPYQDAGKYYRHGSAGIDYAELGAWCRARDGLVIACENEGADWLPFGRARQAATARPGRRSSEVFWVQGDRQLALDLD